MTERKPGPMKARKDIGEVVFPVEKLTTARSAGLSSMCLSTHVVHLLLGDVDLLGGAAGKSWARHSSPHTTRIQG